MNITSESTYRLRQFFVPKGGSKKTGGMFTYHYPCFLKSG
nr:MAG TPA: hypothetical protein [Caudoviricetes sp.]